MSETAETAGQAQPATVEAAGPFGTRAFLSFCHRCQWDNRTESRGRSTACSSPLGWWQATQKEAHIKPLKASASFRMCNQQSNPTYMLNFLMLQRRVLWFYLTGKVENLDGGDIITQSVHYLPLVVKHWHGSNDDWRWTLTFIKVISWHNVKHVFSL